MACILDDGDEIIVPEPFSAGCVARSGFGSVPECLPKKLSSSAVESEVWLSVEPIKPNL